MHAAVAVADQEPPGVVDLVSIRGRYPQRAVDSALGVAQLKSDAGVGNLQCGVRVRGHDPLRRPDEVHVVDLCDDDRTCRITDGRRLDLQEGRLDGDREEHGGQRVALLHPGPREQPSNTSSSGVAKPGRSPSARGLRADPVLRDLLEVWPGTEGEWKSGSPPAHDRADRCPETVIGILTSRDLG